ncbi:MAG: 50S ribosomal protein L11 methyltransferase [Chromatiaceae bacterium]
MFDKSPGTTLDYHRSMLVDTTRTRAFELAIQARVKPGDTVVDLGCGSGILTCFACRAGARRVYAVEEGPVIELAKAVCRLNGFAERVVFINERSTRAILPEPVDVIVTETIGNLGLEEGILGWTADARRRFLKPGGSLIPEAIALFATLVERPEAYLDASDWLALPYGLDFSPARTLACNNPAWVPLPPEACLGEAALLGEVDLARNERDACEGQAEVIATRAGICHGVGGWFRAKLTESISLSNAPPLTTPSWNHGFLPLAQPLAVAAGEVFALRVSVHGNGSLWRWGVRRQAATGHGDAEPALQSTLAGQFLSMADLRKGAGHAVPRLGAKGEAHRFILESMDGSQSLDAIAAAVAVRFPAAFPDPKEAAGLVRRLSRRFAA